MRAYVHTSVRSLDSSCVCAYVRSYVRVCVCHGCSNSIQRVSFGNVTNPRARPKILASNGLATKVIENALFPRALTIPYMVLNFAENDGSTMELSNGTGCEDLSSWWRLVTTTIERSFVRFSESGCSNREVLP